MESKRLLRAIGCFIVAALLIVQPTFGGRPSSARYNLIQGTRHNEDERTTQAMRVLGGVFLVLGLVLVFVKSDLP